MTGSQVLPLPIFPPDPTSERLDLIREANAQIDTDVKIMPRPAVPGSPGRVLAFGEVPDFFSETVLIRPENVDNPDSVCAALEFWLTGDAEPASISHEQWLSAVMGCGVKLIATVTDAEENPAEPTLRGY